jgi:hypothetical protein
LRRPLPARWVDQTTHRVVTALGEFDLHGVILAAGTVDAKQTAHLFARQLRQLPTQATRGALRQKPLVHQLMNR